MDHVDIPEDHRKMLEFFLGFWHRNREVLLEGENLPAKPHSYYIALSTSKKAETLFLHIF